MKLTKTYKFPKSLKRMAISGSWSRELRHIFAEADSTMDIKRKSTSRKDAESYAESSKK